MIVLDVLSVIAEQPIKSFYNSQNPEICTLS